MRRLLSAAAALLALGCADVPTAAPPLNPDPVPEGRHNMGVMLIRFSAVGPGQVLSYGTPGDLHVGSGARFTLSTTKEGSTLVGVQARFLPGAGSFTHGKAGQGGYRYVFGTMKIRNAGVNNNGDTIAYSTAHSNITFVPNGSSGISGTPFSNLRKYDGTAANSSIATSIAPTGAARLTLAGEVTTHAPDALQIFTEAEIATIADALPYGYIVRHATLNNTRTLAANPTAEQFDGLVTFGIKIPLQLNPADDVYGFTMAFNIMDDSETRITQSLEEQDADGQTAFEARVTALANVTGVTVFGGGSYSGSLPVRTLCKVRAAGTAASPTAYIATATTLTSLSPNPFASPGPAFLSTTGAVSATYDDNVSGLSSSSFVVNGAESGRAFLSGASFTGSGTKTVTSPAGNYFAGEEVEITLTSRFGCPFVSHLRVASTGGSGLGSATNFSAGTTARSTALGDLRKNGKLDMVVANAGSNNISVFLGNGAGSFASATNYSVGTSPFAAVLGDLNGDGKLDVVTVNSGSANVSVLLGSGTGTLGSATNYTVGTTPQALVVADVNGDGRLDIITANRTAGASVLLGKGDGTFATATDVQIVGTISTNLAALTLADINGDGSLDLILVNSGENRITVMKGDGAGGFVTPASNFTVGTAPVSAAAGDVNGDGKADLVVLNQTSGNVSVLLGNGSGSFGSATNFSVGTFPGGVGLADVNGDSKLDIITANSGGGNISILLGNGAGSFASATTYSASVGVVSISLGDLNGDGRLDVVAANRQNNNVAVLLGQQ